MTATTSCTERNPLVHLTNTKGVIQTRDGTSYQNNADCRWTLSSNTLLQLQFASFRTHSSADYLTIYDGGSSSSPLIGRFSGRSLPSPIVSSSNKLYLQFTSDGSGYDRGFKAFYRGMVQFLNISKIHCKNGLCACLLSNPGFKTWRLPSGVDFIQKTLGNKERLWTRLQLGLPLLLVEF